VDNGITDKDNLKQEGLKLMRETMLLKNGDAPLTLKLEDMIKVLTDGKATIEKGLAEYIEKEKETKAETEKIEEKKEEKSKEETEFEKKRMEDEHRIYVMRRMMEKISLAERDLMEAEEEKKVSRAYFNMNAYGVPPFEPLSSYDTIDFRKNLINKDYEEMKKKVEYFKNIFKDPERSRKFIEEEDGYIEKLKANKEKLKEAAKNTKESLDFF
jgi:hypothetical protein